MKNARFIRSERLNLNVTPYLSVELNSPQDVAPFRYNTDRLPDFIGTGPPPFGQKSLLIRFLSQYSISYYSMIVNRFYKIFSEMTVYVIDKNN